MKFPNIFKAFKALFRFAQRPDIVPLHVEIHREGRCGRCPHNDNNQCQVCTCFIPLKVKLSTESCPKDFWAQYFSPTKNGL